jgi:hypothetical protein
VTKNNKPEAAGDTGTAIGDDGGVLDVAKVSEEGTHGAECREKGNATHEEFSAMTSQKISLETTRMQKETDWDSLTQSWQQTCSLWTTWLMKNEFRIEEERCCRQTT